MATSANELIFAIEAWPEDGHELELCLEPEILAGLMAAPGEEPPQFTAPLTGHLSLRLLGRRLLLKGRLIFAVEAACDRCLAPVVFDLSPEVDEVIDLVEVGGAEDDEAVTGCLTLAGDRFDLSPLIAELFWLAWPFRVVCREDCLGLCPRCGGNLNSGPCACRAASEVN